MSIISPVISFDVDGPLSGIAAGYFLPGENARIITKDFYYSGQESFDSAIGHITSIYLSKLFEKKILPNIINNFLIISHPKEKKVDIYVNIPTSLRIMAKSSIEANEPVTTRKIAEITEYLLPKEIAIQETDSIIHCFRVQWKFGLFFDLSPADGKHTLNLQELPKTLATCYKTLIFFEDFEAFEDLKIRKLMFEDGWFPFFQLLGGDFKELYRGRLY